MTSFFYQLGYALLLAGMLGMSLFSRKIRAGLWERRGLTGRLKAWAEKDPEPPFWFHVASSGEVEQCLPILEALKAARPRSKVFLSYFSPTAKRALALEIERRARAGQKVPWDYSDYSPFDFGFTVRAYLSILRPRCFVAIHRELWPQLVQECQRRQIGCYLFATYFSPDGAKRLGRYRRALQNFHAIGTTEARSAEALRQALPGVHIAPLGDPRVERVLARREMQRSVPWSDFFEGQKCLVLASVWEEDFTALKPALAMLLKEFPEWRVLITPHEPDGATVKSWGDFFGAHGRKLRRWSQWLNQPDDSSSLVIDGVGFLAELYRVASVVFVGGSFRGRVHNVLEPAAYGCAVVTGPYITNSSEATEMAERDLGLVRTESAEALTVALRKLLATPELRDQYRERLKGYLDEKAGAGQRYAELLLASV